MQKPKEVDPPVPQGLARHNRRSCERLPGDVALPNRHVTVASLRPHMHGHQVTINAIAVVPRAHSSPVHRLGLALYPAASLLNHSCLSPTSFDFQV